MNPLEPTFVDAFRANPIFFVLIGMLAAAAFVVALVALVSLARPRRALVAGIVAGALAVAAMGAGAFAWHSARSTVDEALAIAGLTDRDRERIRAAGYAEAAYPLYFGLAAATLPLLAASVAVLVSLTRGNPAKATAGG